MNIREEFAIHLFQWQFGLYGLAALIIGIMAAIGAGIRRLFRRPGKAYLGDWYGEQPVSHRKPRR